MKELIKINLTWERRKPNTNSMEQKNNSGALFRNEKKNGSQTAPDYTGSVTIEGKKYTLSGWLNTSKDGKNYLRLLLMQADQKEQTVNDLPF